MINLVIVEHLCYLLGQWFLTRDDWAPPQRRHLAMSGDLFGCHSGEGR